MNHLKTTLLAAGTSALLLIGTASLAGDGREVDEALPVLDNGQVRFKIIDGDVKFKSWNKKLVQITGRLENAEDKLIFENEGSDTTIKVESKGHGYNKKGYNYDGSNTQLEVFLPATSQLFAQSTSGDFEIDGMKAGLKAKNVSGDIEISNSSKRIEAYSSSGDITLDKCDGEIHVETVSGELQADVQAERFEASTISGDIDAVISGVKRMEVSSVSGDMDIELEMAKDARLDASTVSGDIEFAFNPKNLDAHFDITTGPGGDINNRLSDDRPESSWVHSEALGFKVGSGESHVEMQTVSGSIALRKK